jgi:hypothetical protein
MSHDSSCKLSGNAKVLTKPFDRRLPCPLWIDANWSDNCFKGVAGLVLVAPAIVALRLSRNDSGELAAALDSVTDDVERDRVAAKFADFRANTAGNLMCVHPWV